MENSDAQLFLSVASVWEMAIKASIGRLTLPLSAEAYVAEKIASGYRILTLTWPQAAAVEQLPFHHRDPFDRLLIAQARGERCAIVTRDRVFRKYGVDVIW